MQICKKHFLFLIYTSHHDQSRQTLEDTANQYMKQIFQNSPMLDSDTKQKPL